MTDGAAARSAWLVAPLAVVPLVVLGMAGADLAWLFLGGATWADAASRSSVVRHSLFLERTVAWFGHLRSRSLIGLAVVYQTPWLGVVAATTFAATDGLAAHHQASKVDWFAPGVLGRFLGFALGLVLVELGVLVGYLTFGVPG